MYNHQMSKGKVTPAIKRAMIEVQLMKEFHWLPQDIKKIPYKDLQLFYIIVRQENENEHQKKALEKYKHEEGMQAGVTTSRGRGQSKRTIKTTKLTP